MEKVIFSDNSGMGIISRFDEPETNFIEKKSVILHGDEIKPDTMTDLDGFFTRKVRFVGLLKTDPDVICFHLGIANDKSYYSCFFVITDTLIFSKYTEKSGRSFNWVNGRWK